MNGPKTIVIGGGLIGLAIARALTERGARDVLVLERHSLASGGTGKSSGIVRMHYGVPSIAAMAWRSLPVFEELGEARRLPPGGLHRHRRRGERRRPQGQHRDAPGAAASTST